MAERGTVVGLDVGRYAVKAAWVELRGGSPVVRRTEMLRLPLDTSDALGVIRPWAEKLKLAGSSCVLAVPGPEAIFQPLVLPPADPRTIEQAASIEVLRFNEMASETMQYGHLQFAGNPGERRLLLSMARPSVVEPLLLFARELGMNLVDLVPAPAALFAALAGDTATLAEPVVFVDMGHASTSVAIGSKVGLMFARAFSGGGQLFAEAIMRRRNITDTQADAFKTDNASMSEGPEDIKAALEEAASLWISELQSCFSVFSSLFPTRDARPARIVFSGGGSRMKGLPEYLAARLNMPVSKVEQLPGKPSPALPETFAVAAGLASLGLQPVASRLSLLPKTLRDEQLFRRQKPYWIASAAVAALTLTVCLAGGTRDIRRKEAHLGIQRAGLARRQQLAAKIDGVKGRIEQIHSMAGPVQAMLTTGPQLRDLVTAVAAALPPDGGDWISMFSDADSYFSKNPFSKRRRKPDAGGPNPAKQPPEQDADAPPAPINAIVLEGYTRTPDFSTVRNLVLAISDLQFVEGADLLSDDKLVVPDGTEKAVLQPGVQRFVLEIRLKKP